MEPVLRVRSCDSASDCATSDEYSLEYGSSCPFIFANNGNKFQFEAEAASAGSCHWVQVYISER